MSKRTSRLMDVRKALKRQQRWTDKKLYPWVLASLALSIVQSLISLRVIGDERLYHLWITWIPLGIGLMVLTVVRRKYLMLRLADMEGFAWKLLLCAFLLVQGLLFSYMSFGLVARTTADMLNRQEVRDGAERLERYAIHDAFMKGRNGQHLTFIREGRLEMVHPGYVKELDGQRWDPPFDIILTTAPGILGTTILLDYSWEKVERTTPTPEDQTN